MLPFFFLFFFFFFFFNDTATTEIYTLSLHDALPIPGLERRSSMAASGPSDWIRSTSSCPEIGRAHVELQSRENLVCRLLPEKKKKKIISRSNLSSIKETNKTTVIFL